MMRISRLDLLRYGHFENTSLDFPRRAHDIHIVSGRNEAGKSTLLAAIGDFLFGFPHAVGQNWRFDAPMLRVGASLEVEGQTLGGIRRRGRDATLRDSLDNAAIDETLLQRNLQGLTRKDYERLWSLDHTRLREGGREMTSFGGDAGQQLLSAGFGLTGVHEILRSLDEETGGLWKRGGRVDAINTARRQLQDAQKALRDGASMQEWKAANAKLNDLEARIAALDATIAEQDRQGRHIERLRRVAPFLARRRSLMERLSGRETPLFSEMDEHAFEAARDALAQLRQNHRIEQNTLDALILQDEACQPDAAILADADAIERLRDRTLTAHEAIVALPAQRQTLATQEAALGELARVIGLPGDAAAIRARLPENASFKPLHDLLRERIQLDTRDDHARKILSDTERTAAITQAGTVPAEDAPPLQADSLRVLLERARSLGDLDAALTRGLSILDDACAQRDDALARLHPWSGSFETLRRMVLPDTETLGAAQKQSLTLEGRLATAEQETRLARQTLEKFEHERLQLAKRGAISTAQVADARRCRDEAWEAVLQALQTERRPGNEALEAVTRTLREADVLTDRRFAAAAEAAQLAQRERDIETASLSLRQAQETQEASLAALDVWNAAWARQCERDGLPALAPGPLAAWCARRFDAMEADRQVRALEQERTTRFSALTHATARLREAGVMIQPEASLADAIALAETHHRALAATEAARKEREKSREDAAAALAAARAEQALVTAARTTWDTRWAAACARVSLPAETTQDTLSRVEDARKLAHEILSLRQTIQTVEAARDSHANELAALAMRHGVPAGDAPTRLAALISRRGSALEDARHKAGLGQRLSAARDTLAALMARMQAQRTALAPFETRAGTTDPGALQAAIAASRETRDLLAERGTTEHELFTQGDGLPVSELDAQSADQTPDDLIAAQERLEAERQLHKNEREVLMHERVEARATLRRIEEVGGTTDAAADVQAALAEIGQKAALYINARLEAVILKRIVARQRSHSHNPLLQRASAFFHRLTLGRYASLSIVEDPTHELVAQLSDSERMVRVGQMSEGTADQLFLALRLAALDQDIARGRALPVLADDLFMTFDDARARAGLELLGDISRRTQVIFLTHHAHLAEMASDVLNVPPLDITGA